MARSPRDEIRYLGSASASLSKWAVQKDPTEIEEEYH